MFKTLKVYSKCSVKKMLVEAVSQAFSHISGTLNTKMAHTKTNVVILPLKIESLILKCTFCESWLIGYYDRNRVII